MYAYRMNTWGETTRLVEAEKPIPKAGEILVKVAGNGLCQSDLHLPDIPEAVLAARGWQVPFTLGHEVGGWVEESGAGVTGLGKGQAVALVCPQSCSVCLECQTGHDNVCSHGSAGRGFGRNGGLAEYVIVDSLRPLINLNKLDPLTAAPLTDAGSTAYHAVNRVREKLVQDSASAVLVVGAGGLGSFAVQYLKILTRADIIVADTNEKALQRAAKFGAHACLDSQSVDLSREVDKLTEGRGALAVLDFVGSDQTISTGLASLGRRGSYVLIGAGNGGHPAPLWPALAMKGADIYSFQGPTLADTHAVIALAEQGELSNPIQLFDFQEPDISEAYEKLRRGQLNGRAVIRCH